MPVPGPVYDVPDQGAHATDNSSGTADVKTIVPPNGATGCVVCVETNGCRATFDGSAPDATNGLPINVGGPVWLPFASTIKFVSRVAASSHLRVLWLF